ncbi:hypothetical protein HKX48_005374 [Thoreauomyces humboldtii]|nr:hypothetical protein HKX48_005374 [Thoreauomyces humboldtii]
MTQHWEPGCQYNAGAVVEYHGSHYKIIQSDWAPDVVPALWGRVPDDECHQHKQQDSCHGQEQQQHHRQEEHHHKQEHQNDCNNSNNQPMFMPVAMPEPHQQQQHQAPYMQVPPAIPQPQNNNSYGYVNANNQTPAFSPSSNPNYGSVNNQQPTKPHQQQQQQQHTEDHGLDIAGHHIGEDALKIGGGLLAGAAVLGLGGLAYHKMSSRDIGDEEGENGQKSRELADAQR